MKQPTDKDLRLYASLSDVDSQFILDSTIPLKAAPVPAVKKASKPSLWAILCRPQNASVALAALLVTLTVVALLVTGITKGPQTEPPPHGIPTDPIGSIKSPTTEDAAALRKGMSLSELAALMGNHYTQEGTCYTFTLDTGEQLTVSTAPNDGGEPTVTGFEWLGSAGKTYNPMGIPAEILQKVQEYATDTVIPVYAMESLFLRYTGISLPSVTDVLKDAEVHYLRTGADGETALLDGEGHGAGGYPQDEAFSFLEDVSALFDESVRVKAYYPILTEVERGAVYIVTSVGDYVFYFHENPAEEPNASTEITPYLMPAPLFHRFAYWVLCRHGDIAELQPTVWNVPSAALEVIEPYSLASENFVKPVNKATPAAAATVKKGMEYSDIVEILGLCPGCANSGRRRSSPSSNPATILPEKCPPSDGLHCWELTDGSALAVFFLQKRLPQSPSSNPEYTYPVGQVISWKSAEVLDSIGSVSLATYALVTEGMELSIVRGILGEPLDSAWSEEDGKYIWKWMEDGQAHTLQVYWSGGYGDSDRTVASMEHSVMTIEEVVGEIKKGSSFADIVARLGPCRDGHEVDTFGGTSKSGYHFWTLPDGRCLAAYIGYNIPALTDPLGLNFERHFNMTVMHLLYLDSPNSAGIIGTPGLSMAEEVQTGMKEQLVKALMGNPTATVEGLQSVWEWSEGGKTYILTVYWKDNAPVGFHRNFNTVSRYELDAETSSAPLIPDKIPTLANAQVITEGMTASELLTIMGSRVHAVTGVGYTYYIWTLSDGQAFCAVTEDDVTNADQSERIVTYTYFRDSVEAMYVATTENMEAVTEGMSLATVYALLGTEVWDTEYDYPSSLTATWGTSEGAWWEITVTFEAVEYPETNRSRAYVSSVYIDKGI